MSPLLIYSNLSVPSLVSLRADHPLSLKLNSDRLPSLRVSGQDKDEDLEGDLEEDLTEFHPEIRLDLNLESESDSVLPYYYFYYLPCF